MKILVETIVILYREIRRAHVPSVPQVPLLQLAPREVSGLGVEHPTVVLIVPARAFFDWTNKKYNE